MKVGLLGGTFNPIHKGHIALSKKVKTLLSLNEVWLIPTYITTDKKHFEVERITPHHRLRMVEEAVKQTNLSWLKVNKIEIKLKGVSYTYRTIRELKKRYPKINFYFIIGDDRYLDFHTWEFADEILRSVKLVVYNRTQELEDSKHKVDFTKFIYLKDEIFYYSSTKIRKKFSWEDIAPGAKEYIAKNYLYLKRLIFENLPSDRYQHSLLVALHARRLANKYFWIKSDDAYYAGLVHDMFKTQTIRWQERIFYDNGENIPLVPLPALHGYTAAVWLEKEYGITNQDFVNAVRNHTLAAPNMSKLEKVVFLADKLASDRNKKSFKRLRRLAYLNFDYTFKKVIKRHYSYLKKNHILIPKITEEAYQQYVLGKDLNKKNKKQKYYGKLKKLY